MVWFLGAGCSISSGIPASFWTAASYRSNRDVHLSKQVLGTYATFVIDVLKDVDRAEEYFRQAVEIDPNNVANLGNYANLLGFMRRDAGRAETLYRRAMELDPTHAVNLNTYGVFAGHIRRDVVRAEELLRMAVESDPTYANGLGDYAQLLFGRGADAEAVQHCEAALEHSTVGPSLLLEIAFYFYAHVPARAGRALDDLRRLLADGSRSDGWDFTVNLDRARAARDPRLPFLTALADVIAGRAELATLDRFPEWTGQPVPKAKRPRRGS